MTQHLDSRTEEQYFSVIELPQLETLCSLSKQIIFVFLNIPLHGSKDHFLLL